MAGSARAQTARAIGPGDRVRFLQRRPDGAGKPSGALAVIKGGGLEKYWTENEAFHCVGGNQPLAMRLLETIGADDVHVQMPVERIEINEGAVKACCLGGRTFEADDLVLAIPPSTWHHIRFEPALPAALRPQMGKNVKFLLGLRDDFWTKENFLPRA